MLKMNRFQKFLEQSRIAAGYRQSAAERASYFVWYHMRATGEPDADLELIAAYLKESGTPVPDLHVLYGELIGPGQMVTRAPIPGRVRMLDGESMNKEYEAAVFHSKGLAPFYFQRSTDGELIRIGSTKDLIKYWPQRSWVAAWGVFLLGVLGLLSAFAIPLAIQTTVIPTGQSS